MRAASRPILPFRPRRTLAWKPERTLLVHHPQPANWQPQPPCTNPGAAKNAPHCKRAWRQTSGLAGGERAPPAHTATTAPGCNVSPRALVNGPVPGDICVLSCFFAVSLFPRGPGKRCNLPPPPGVPHAPCVGLTPHPVWPPFPLPPRRPGARAARRGVSPGGKAAGALWRLGFPRVAGACRMM